VAAIGGGPYRVGGGGSASYIILTVVAEPRCTLTIAPNSPLGCKFLQFSPGRLRHSLRPKRRSVARTVNCKTRALIRSLGGRVKGKNL
jgi:hypothetical protein